MYYGEFLSSFLIDLQRLFRLDISIKDITYSQVLAIISIPNDGVEMSELARKLGLDNSTVTRLIVRLEKKDWVGREKSKRDKRAIKVFLKTKGLVIQQDIEKKIESIGEKIKMEIDDEKRESILEHLFTFQWGLRKTFLKK
jgi:DNA-binding MarR family transcriptional regulator|tara:strand:- start:749 stop:1171 length:423 start_codon:yes stop_codon:yes gene_type:complete